MQNNAKDLSMMATEMGLTFAESHLLEIESYIKKNFSKEKIAEYNREVNNIVIAKVSVEVEKFRHIMELQIKKNHLLQKEIDELRSINHLFED